MRGGSAFHKLGVRNGDIVHSVNGRTLTTPSDAMAAYDELTTERSFTFEITRGAKRTELHYEVE